MGFTALSPSYALLFHLRGVAQVEDAGDPHLSSGMMAASDCQLIGRWRIVEADLWDRDYLDLVEAAYIVFGTDGRGEFAFGVVNASMELEYGKTIVFFTFAGFDEGDRICGSGSAEAQENGSLEIELSFHAGDDAILTARRMG